MFRVKINVSIKLSFWSKKLHKVLKPMKNNFLIPSLSPPPCLRSNQKNYACVSNDFKKKKMC